MTHFLSWSLLGFGSAVVCASFFEWLLHRFVMHRPLGNFVYAFRTHTLTHHRVFKADHSYHLHDAKDAHTIPMAWWNGPLLIVLMLLPFIGAGWALGSPAVTWGALLAFSAYYSVYETLHWCMHQPGERPVERTGFFFRLNGHHLLHHRYMRKNFNVVLPLADLCLGTLLLRSKVRFAQATGSTVPDVQPRTGVPFATTNKSQSPSSEETTLEVRRPSESSGHPLL